MPDLREAHPFDFCDIGERILDQRARGQALARIAVDVGVSQYKVKEYLDHYLRRTYSNRDDLITQAALELDYVLRGFDRLYHEKGASSKDRREALTGILKTNIEKRKLFGSDKPIQVDVKHLDDLPDEELAREAERWGIETSLKVVAVTPALPAAPSVTPFEPPLVKAEEGVPAPAPRRVDGGSADPA